MPHSPDSLNQDIEKWLSKNEFDKIDNAFKRADKSNKKFNRVFLLQPKINDKKNAFINRTILTANKYKQSNQWQLALDTYINALNKIKNETRLKKEMSKLIQQRDRQVTELRKTMLMKRANALISYKIIYEKLHRLIPQDYSAKFDISRYDKDSVEVAGYLKMCGDQALKNKQLSLARDCYSLSNKLQATKEKRILVAKISSQLSYKSSQKRYNELLNAHKLAYSKHEYNKAKLHLKTLLAINPSHTKAKKLLTALNKEVSEQTLSKIQLGKALYSEKKINAALQIWQEALQLEPDNSEILQLIERAQTVSKKIKALQKSQY